MTPSVLPNSAYWLPPLLSRFVCVSVLLSVASCCCSDKKKKSELNLGRQVFEANEASQTVHRCCRSIFAGRNGSYRIESESESKSETLVWLCFFFRMPSSLLVETPSTHPTPYHTIPSQSTQHHSIPLYSLYTLLHYLATWVGHVSYRVFQCFFGPFGCCLLLVLFAFRWLACICICAEDIALVTSRRRRLCVTKSHIKTFIRNLFKLGCLRCATSKVLYLFIYISSFLENQRGLIII